jgi:hypothetical protein
MTRVRGKLRLQIHHPPDPHFRMTVMMTKTAIILQEPVKETYDDQNSISKVHDHDATTFPNRRLG